MTHQPQRLKFTVQKSTVKVHVKLIMVMYWKIKTLTQLRQDGSDKTSGTAGPGLNSTQGPGCLPDSFQSCPA